MIGAAVLLGRACLSWLKGAGSSLVKALTDWRVLAVIAAVLGLLWGLHETRRADGLAVAKKASDAALVASQRALQAQGKQTAATSGVDRHTTQAIAQTQATTSANLQTVRLYVPPVADSRCIIGVGAVRLLDAAAHDQPVSVPAIGLQDADSGVALSDVIQADVANAGSYHTLAERLKAWDDWYDAQKAVSDGR